MDEEPINRVIAAVVRQDGVSPELAASQVQDFMGKVDCWMVAGINPLELFVERFRLPEDYFLELLFS